MTTTIERIEAEYSDTIGADVRISEFEVHGDSEFGTFIDSAGSVFNFHYDSGTNDLEFDYNPGYTQAVNAGCNGYLMTLGYIEEPRADATAFLYGMSSHYNKDAAPKCSPGNQPCGNICIPKTSTCRKGKGSLKQGAGERRKGGMSTATKVGLGAAGLAGLGAAGAAGLALGTKSGRRSLKAGKAAYKKGEKDLRDYVSKKQKERSGITPEGFDFKEYDEQDMKAAEAASRSYGKGVGRAVASVGRSVSKGGKEVARNVKSGAKKMGESVKKFFNRGEKKKRGGK